MTDHPTTPATDHPTVNGRPVAPTTDRHRPVDWSGLRGRLSRWGNPTTDRALQLAAEHLADQATRPRRHRWFGRRPTTVDQATRPARRPRKTATQRLDEVYAHLVLAAPLVVAGWFQAHAINFLLAAPWVVAIGFTTAWEGGAGYCARLYVRALLRRDSTIVLRLGMLTFAGVSCGLLWLELHMQERPPWLAAAVGALVTSGIFLWCRRARDLHRDALHADGMVDAAVVRFSFASWIAAPIETPAAMRYAIKHRISHPVEAIEAYRADRQRRRTARALRSARERARTERMKTTAPTAVTDHSTTPARKPVDRPGEPTATSAALSTTDQPTDRPVDGAPKMPQADREGSVDRTRRRPRPTTYLRSVGEPTAVANARLLRKRYPTGLPDSMRQIRAETGWSKGRVDAAVEKYSIGADQVSANVNKEQMA